ncbi:hypothetical protein SBA3_3970009 [Candidatus Sulfopaludibacter sp. SbA3]|nr:hypothetical protein SBA3_3970009 [Candidatus Sulfopaludibacter sp. SbA3]
MRFLLWAAIPAILWGQSGAPLEGTVIDSVTHTPLAGVGVTVVSTSAQHHATYVTATDADGTFRIGNIDQDGEFKADFEKRGFLSVSRNPVRLSAATGPVRLYVELVPHPQLRGRVVDPDGHPVSEARVQLLGVRGNWAINTPVSKDGTFAVRNSLPSAAFLVRAEPGPKLPPPESAEDEPRVWAPTYYPSGTDQSQAVRVVWRGDADLDGYEIRLRAVPVFHVRGTVLDERGKPAAGVAVKLLPADGIDAAMQLHETSEAQTVSANDGTFEIPSVRPGDWRLSVEWKRGGQMLSGFGAAGKC